MCQVHVERHYVCKDAQRTAELERRGYTAMNKFCWVYPCQFLCFLFLG